jgi:Ca2+:H+ antiporter
VRTASSSSQVIDDASTHSPNAKRSGQESVTPEQERPQLSTESSSEVTTRDFTVDPENWATGEKKRKISRYARSKEQKRRNSEEDIIEEGVPFPPLGGEVEGAASKRPFNIRNISYKPALPRALNPNIFSPSQAQPGPLAAAPAPGVGGSNRLRRTSSLPDRLNKSVPGPAAVAAATAIPSAQPLPHLVSKKRVVEVKDDPGEKPKLDRVTAIILLLVTTALVAVCAEFLVDSIDYLVSTTGVSEAFIGLIILPIVGNAAEHVTAVTVASKNKMDLAIGVALGSSIQIALFVTPVIVLLGWILDTEMSLYFSLFETVSLFASAFIVNYLMLDGRSNYLEGALLIAAYVIIAVSAYFYPSCDNTSTLNGGTMTGQC